MNILGISAYYHDSAAALVRDGEIIAAAQEERFTRIKHDHEFPRHAIHSCLKQCGLSAEDLDQIVFYDKPFLKFERILETYLQYAPRGISSFLKAMPLWMKKKLWIRSLIEEEMPEFTGEILFSEHHLSHAASAFYPSPFSEAAIITVDGVGEWTTTSIGFGQENRIDMISEIHFPHSLGMLYSAFTYYTGFRVNSGEYKVMGLAPYGEPVFVQKILDHLIDVKEDGSFRLNMKYFDFAAGLTMTNKKFNRLFSGAPRKPESQLTERDMDLARSAQEVVDMVMLRMARHARKLTGSDYLCLAGGVALNCVANGKLLRENIFKDIWIQPAAGDAGGALGAALAGWHNHKNESRPKDSFRGMLEGKNPKSKVQNLNSDIRSNKKLQYSLSGGLWTSLRDLQKGSYLGPEFSREEIELFLNEREIPFRLYEREELVERTASFLADEKVIGWFQGPMEFGPRALGNRSILGDARSANMQREMNLKIKYRESFRPFAPAVMSDHVHDYFTIDRASPYMLLVADVQPGIRTALTDEDSRLTGIDKLNISRSTIPAVTHVDYSARIQTVHHETNPLFYELLNAFHKRTGCAVLINTSFNVRGEPIVCTPEDAYKCFLRTNIDYLVMGNFVLDKGEQAEGEKNFGKFELD